MYQRKLILVVIPLLLAVAFAWAGCEGTAPVTSEDNTDPLEGERINSFYTNEDIAYLLDVTLWRDTLFTNPIITKWSDSIRIGVRGNPTEQDLATLKTVVEELNGLAREIGIVITEGRPNVEVYFIPRAAFSFINAEYTFPAFGFTSWSTQPFVQEVEVLVATDSTSQEERNGWIYRGLAASLGLTNTSPDYPESVFYTGWKPTPGFRYAQIDRTVIEILYSSGILPGMTRQGSNCNAHQ